MYSMLFAILFIAFRVAGAAQSMVCIAGQCLQGYSNTTIGAKLSVSGETILLLPGQYRSTTGPQELNNALTSSSATLDGSDGFQSGPVDLPLNLQLQPGLAIYSQSLYSGQSSFGQLPSSPVNGSTPLSANSIAISSTIWVAVSSNNKRMVLWDSIPDTSQLPSTGSLSILDIQSTACSPPCSGSGICSASGKCACAAGFSGSSCESCAEGFFGPNCQPCPQGCSTCDQGISGSGRCLSPVTGVLPSSCNCLNGVCESNGQCTCNVGWTTSNNGTACAQCSPGFYLKSPGYCQVCPQGCDQCMDGTGGCTSCKTGFTPAVNVSSVCVQTQSKPDGTFCQGVSCASSCAAGTYGTGTECSSCSPSCSTCVGSSPSDCTTCPEGSSYFNGNCVQVNDDGVCQGTNGMAAILDECRTCGGKCTSCTVPNFSSTNGDLNTQSQCTGCIPGSFLFQGQCIGSCPTGTFVSPQDNMTCTACSSSCSTCTGSPDFCLSCPSGQLLLSGSCVASCPSNSYSSSNSCTSCHPDCSTCSGSSFNQCNSCPSSRPVLANGRCLSTCSKSQYFDTATSTCQTCDSSCSSCSGPGSNDCLACSSSTQVLRGGSCVDANCQNSSTVISGLGVCLSDLVQVSNVTAPSATQTTVVVHKALSWWDVVLIILGCAFIIIMILWFWRRRARIRRALGTRIFAREKNIDDPHGWRWRLFQFGERLFGHRRNNLPSELPMTSDPDPLHSPSIQPIERDINLGNMASTKSRAKTPSRKKRETMSDMHSHSYPTEHRHSPFDPYIERRRKEEYERRVKARFESDSQPLPSEVTGNQQRSSEPRQPSIGSSAVLAMKPATTSQENGKHQVTQVTGNPSNLTDHQMYRMAAKPTITGTLSQGQAPFPIPTYHVPPTFAAPIGPTGPVPQHTGANILPVPVALTGDGQGSYWLTSTPPMLQSQGHVQQPPPVMVMQPIHTAASHSENPFRKGQ